MVASVIEELFKKLSVFGSPVFLIELILNELISIKSELSEINLCLDTLI